MTLEQLINDAMRIGRMVTSTDIPVVYQGMTDNLTSLELSQDNEGNYYVKIK